MLVARADMLSTITMSANTLWDGTRMDGTSLATSEKIERATHSIEEVALILGIGRANAYELARTGQLPVLRLGARRLVVPKRALERLLDRVPDDVVDRER